MEVPASGRVQEEDGKEPPINPTEKDFLGQRFAGRMLFYNVAKIAMQVFDLRQAKQSPGK